MEKEHNNNVDENLNDQKKTESIDSKLNTSIPEKEVKNEEHSIEKNPEDKILELEDKLARTFAEMENQRRRFEKEKEEAFEYGGFNFAKEALSIIDNLERSKQILQNDQSLKDSQALKKILDHLEIINKDLISIFSKNNINPIECLNKKLDPNFHQAMIEIEDDHKEPGTIIQEIQKGFTIKERLLRPSLVGVSKRNKEDKEIKQNKENLENKK
jgi:molecular chaperone GrpE